MEKFQLLILSIGITVIGLFGLLLLPTQRKSTGSTVLVIINSILTSIPAIYVLNGNVINMALAGSAFFGPVPIRIDALAAWFILIINFTSINGAIYGIGYMKPYEQQKTNISLHWSLYPVFHLSMIWVCMVQHSLAFLFAWEIMSLSSMLLVIFEYQKKNTLKAGVNYLVQMHVGVALLTIAFIWVYASERSFDFRAIGAYFNSHPNVWLFILFFIGFGIKAGFIPFHTWLPQAHPAAPSHISGVMSGVIVKLGIYGIFRVITLVKHDYYLLGEVVIGISLLSGLFGIFNAAVHRNYKKMLAYCTIENIGIIGLGLGLGLMGLATGNNFLVIAGFGGSLLHTLNHSLFKSLLFFSAGSIYQQTHTKNMEKLGGLIKRMPQTAWIFLIGSIAIGGLPPFNGFVSEFILYRGFLEGLKSSDFYFITLMVISIASLAIIGGLSLMAFTKSFGTIFLGSPRTTLPHEPHEVSLMMRIPQFLIIAVMLSIGIYPQFYFTGAIQTVASIFPVNNLASINALPSIIGLISQVGLYSLLFLILIMVVYLVRSGFAKQHPVSYYPTWVCAYTAPNAGMQYTGKSFTKSLAKLLGLIVTEKKKYSEITTSEIFPKNRHYSSYYVDNFSTYINRVTDRMVYAMNYFEFIQNGNIQMYILYGVIFIVLVFLGTLFNFI